MFRRVSLAITSLVAASLPLVASPALANEPANLPTGFDVWTEGSGAVELPTLLGATLTATQDGVSQPDLLLLSPPTVMNPPIHGGTELFIDVRSDGDGPVVLNDCTGLAHNIAYSYNLNTQSWTLLSDARVDPGTGCLTVYVSADQRQSTLIVPTTDVTRIDRDNVARAGD